jgi:hypothetical protein
VSLDHREEDETLLANLRTGDWLDSVEFPPLRYAVPELLPEGFTLLAGSPKVGKSWLVLDMLLSVAGAGRALSSISVPESRPVLYLALEDGDRRMQERCRTILDDRFIPRNFHYVTDCTYPLMTIRAWLERYDGAVIVLDTLGKVMEDGKPGDNSYQRDYKMAGGFKSICADFPGVSILAVHHDRKATSDDFVQSVSGTNGIAGAADTIMILNRARNSDDGLLKVTGRDVLESEYALIRSGPSWRLHGGTLESARDAATSVRNSMKAAGLGPRMQETLELVNQHPEGISPKLADAALGATDSRTYLPRLVERGLIESPRRGLYVPVATVATLQTVTADVTSQHLQHDFEEFDDVTDF